MYHYQQDASPITFPFIKKKSTQFKPAQTSGNAPYANPIYSNPHGSLKQPYSHINTTSIFALQNALLRMVKHISR
ncbi:11744_t:CDS:2 [Acaulospora colombiana]|uniref:11744_t:CDS:1 n=1 Tax=Acaulospora colombiana TaxID=27376 RepID=A0ACA9MH88_9GLOM|nr:11744_t:CDS:2 [Acaulospora colombiana]